MDLDRDRLRAAGWIAAAVLVAVLAVRALGGGDDGSAAVSVEPDSAESPPGASAPGPSGTPLLVHVAGEVRRPGVYRVPRGARIHDAVQLAGGLTRRAEQAGVNLVARITDGQQVVVPRRGAAAAPGPPGAASASPEGGAGGSAGPKVSLATATPEQLDAIDGIGPTLARRIVEYREQHGGFRSIDELRQVEGIGEKRFESLREAVTP